MGETHDAMHRNVAAVMLHSSYENDNTSYKRLYLSFYHDSTAKGYDYMFLIYIIILLVHNYVNIVKT